MAEVYATGSGGQRYRTRADYVAGRVTSSNTRQRQVRRVLGSGR